MEVLVHGEAAEFQLDEAADSASKANGNGDGFSYCYERGFRLVNPSAVSNFFTLDTNSNMLTLVSNSNDDIGQYTVEVEIYLKRNTSIKNVQTMTITVNPCRLEVLIAD